MKRTEALAYRAQIEHTAQTIPEEEAYEHLWMYRAWTTEGRYDTGEIFRHDGKLWKCRQNHIGQAAFEPSVFAAALWELLPMPGETGTQNNPIVYDAGMALESGKYYRQYGEVYLCTRDTGNPVYNDLRELTGLYVELVR